MSGRGDTLETGTSKRAWRLPMSSDMGLPFSARRISMFLKSRKHQATAPAAVFLAAVLQILAAEVLELAGNAATDRIRSSHIRLAARTEKELNTLLGDAARNDEKMSKVLGDIAMEGWAEYP